jgi:hypothetical protein
MSGFYQRGAYWTPPGLDTPIHGLYAGLKVCDPTRTSHRETFRVECVTCRDCRRVIGRAIDYFARAIGGR